MKDITDLQRSEPADGRPTVKLVDKDDTNKGDDDEDGSTKIEGQKILNSVVNSNKDFINKLVEVTSLGTNIILHYETWLHFFT